MKNLLYLKRYVKMHPNNRMGWYLLGKEYESDGQMGKANYCYNKAGDVYEAFEHSKVPADILKDYEAKLMEMAEKRDRKIRRWRYSVFAILLLFLITLRSVEAPHATDQTLADRSSQHIAKPPTKVASATSKKKPADTFKGYSAPLSFTAEASLNNTNASLSAVSKYMRQQMLKTAPQVAAVLGMEKQDDWLLWTPNMPVLYTMAATDQPGQIDLQSYDPKACQCKPGELDHYPNESAAWVQQQEQLVVMRTAMINYITAKGNLPEQMNQLEAPFPGNWLAGNSDTMNQTFTALKKLQSSGSQSTDDSGNTIGDEAFSSTLGNHPYFTKPLEVIVDKQKHRLAIVSGSIILRNYEVGLGGSKTPEGTFQVSIKVMNPNGKANGEFGSRGMQLSDTNYAIHGTNDPDSVGQDESLGCVRMDQADVEELFDMIPLGTKVTIASNVLPGDTSVPSVRFQTKRTQDQTDPSRHYHWLN
ncbi:L,D-transpeptidase [Paenibacillus sp. KACC 21273]|uniref:L,D-transpeptidase n=1 Tax=Paenibacillus sp. KACC 21273 TaxID=3025665 RepID=UPI0023663DFB|nr:L,D-transpeptidase [Paenibacillus sp. KACC 21273]WDF49478.1 L,D-transpeptidase [Paenibacillus sp. KACC 21273]